MANLRFLLLFQGDSWFQEVLERYRNGIGGVTGIWLSEGGAPSLGPAFGPPFSSRVRQLAVGARLVHGERQLVRQHLRHLVDRNVVFGGDLPDRVVAEHLLELVGSDREILAVADPGFDLVAEAGLLELGDDGGKPALAPGTHDLAHHHRQYGCANLAERASEGRRIFQRIEDTHDHSLCLISGSCKRFGRVRKHPSSRERRLIAVAGVTRSRISRSEASRQGRLRSIRETPAAPSSAPYRLSLRRGLRSHRCGSDAPPAHTSRPRHRTRRTGTGRDRRSAAGTRARFPLSARYWPW